MRQIDATRWIKTAMLGLLVAPSAAVAGPEKPKNRPTDEGTNQESPPATVQTENEEGGEPVRLHLEVIRLTLPAELVGAPAEAAGRPEVEKLVSEAYGKRGGDVRYVFDTPVMVGGPKGVTHLTRGSQAPFVVGSTTSENGQKHKTIQYKDVGCVIDLAARWSEDTSSRRIAASWKIEIKDLVNS